MRRGPWYPHAAGHGGVSRSETGSRTFVLVGARVSALETYSFDFYSWEGKESTAMVCTQTKDNAKSLRTVAG